MSTLTCPACHAIINAEGRQADEVLVCLQCGSRLPPPAESVAVEEDADTPLPVGEAVESEPETAGNDTPTTNEPSGQPLELPKGENARPSEPFEMLPMSPAPVSASPLPAGRKSYPPPPPPPPVAPPPFFPPAAPAVKPRPATPPPFVPTTKPQPSNIPRANPVKNYRIVEADTAPNLQNLVLDALDRGWQPQGGIAVGYSSTSGKWWYYQAMIRVE